MGRFFVIVRLLHICVRKMVFESKTSAVMMSFIEGSEARRDSGDTGQLVRRRKKRRAADAKVKKFSGEHSVLFVKR